MFYRPEQVREAFKIYIRLAERGCGEREDMRLYFADEEVRGLVDEFAREVDCTIIVVGDYLYLVPLAVSSPFHVSNEAIKKEHLPARATNIDLYTMYVAIIVLFGEFYDSYQTTEPTRDFLPLEEWLNSMNQRIQALKEIDPEELERQSREYEYNWKAVVERWDAMDDLRETARTQDARTVSRLSFLNVVRGFLISQGLIVDVGENEVALTEKARIIIQRYYMEAEFNRGILEFMYQFDLDRGRG